MKTVIGVGIISLPYTLSKFGYVFGAIVFAIVGLLSQMSSILLLNSKNLSKKSNYSTIFYHIYPKKLSKAIGSITILLANVGMCIKINMQVLLS
jgi:amino acid permease